MPNLGDAFSNSAISFDIFLFIYLLYQGCDVVLPIAGRVRRNHSSGRFHLFSRFGAAEQTMSANDIRSGLFQMCLKEGL